MKFSLLIFLLCCFSCQKDGREKQAIKKSSATTEKLFSNVSSDHSGLHFVNTLEENEEFNYYQYVYAYMGGGVAIGDINNDGLEDVYFSSNTVGDRLYLNKGNLQFEDITETSGISESTAFNTGVTMADVNNDGAIDIYVSRGGWKEEEALYKNRLYINNGDLTFTEGAEEFGLADSNRTIQATFFDYDNDNDLDVYLSNSPKFVKQNNKRTIQELHNDPKGHLSKGIDKLYNNDGSGHFDDVSEKAGLLKDQGYGLNPQVGDLNNDGWMDIYVCNDFSYPDLAYINNGDGTFTESSSTLFRHMSLQSMGGDIADINNDGLMDVMTLDMSPEDYYRSKTTMAMTSIKKFEDQVAKGYQYQYMHNMLQLNNGNDSFGEISNMAGVTNTDWSWAVLLADFDLDGFNDIYVTNGVYRDVLDRDKVNKTLEILRRNNRKPTKKDFLQFTQMLPQQKLNNYFFKNNGDLTFENATSTWADTIPTFSNGAAYADLDNDGDLDIIVNNINDKVTLLQNNARQLNKGNFLTVKLKGPDTNIAGIGAKAKLSFSDGTFQTRELINTRGFLSSTVNSLHFGYTSSRKLNRLEVFWPDGKYGTSENLSNNNVVVIAYKDAVAPEKNTAKNSKIFSKTPLDLRHIDPSFNDYDIQLLLPHKLSQTGPSVTNGDVNNDGLEDVYIGGGKGQPGQLVLAKSNGNFQTAVISDFIADKDLEDQGAIFFDANSDGNLDLYVTSGSYENYKTTTFNKDRFYLGNGKGGFTKSTTSIPTITSSGSVVKTADFDADGDLDIFVGSRVLPGKYPHAPTSHILINDKGVFTDKSKEIFDNQQQLGMVTDAIWTDMNQDGKIDLIVTGEWMGIDVYINNGTKLLKSANYKELTKSKGWWNRLLLADVDNDGDDDIIAGNLGLNYKFYTSEAAPFHLYASDFDLNGVEDVILAKDYKGKKVPVRGKSCMTAQIPHLANKVASYADFANNDLEEILGKKVKSALYYEATEFRSGIFYNNGTTTADQSHYSFIPFGNEVQRSPVNSILFEDFDKDNQKDIMLAGNNFQSEIETTRADAGIGSFLKGTGKGMFTYVPNSKTGFFASKDVRNMIKIGAADGSTSVLIINNNDTHQMYQTR